MRKIIVHREEIVTSGAKLQFQIKLPETIERVTGIFVGITRIRTVPGPVDLRDVNMGSIWLRVPEQRDVFYADFVRQFNHLRTGQYAFEFLGQAMTPEWWFAGTRYTFFDVTVPIEDTLIEGYYEDESQFAPAHYYLSIYLNLELHD